MINSNKELPEGIQRLPQKAQSMYRESYNAMYSKHKDESISSKIAWNVVKKQFHKVDNQWVGKGMSAETYTFNIDTKEDMFIQKADDGNFYIEGTLSDIFPDSDGWSFTEEALENFAAQINNLPLFGGITHQEWQELKMKYSHLSENEFIAKARTERKGILKTIKAIYENGKLWIKALVDKRYINHVKKFNKMSLEAFVPPENKKGKQYTGGTILGFALDNNAINPRAIVKHN